MHRMPSVDNLSWNISIFNSFLILLNLENDLSLERLVSMKLRNKDLSVWTN